jgi:Domain of unknown function (DUF1707)
MAGPGDEIAAGRGHLRASHADREQVIGILKAAFVQGMLDRDEFGQRVSQAFAARTYADLAALTGDVPARLTGTRPPRTPARARSRKPIDKRVKVAAQVACLSIPQAVLVAAFFLTDNGTFFILSVLYFVLVTSFTGALMVEAWEQKRSYGQSPRPPAPGAGGQASRACHRRTRAGSFLRPVTVTGTSPRQPGAVVPVVCGRASRGR